MYRPRAHNIAIWIAASFALLACTGGDGTSEDNGTELCDPPLSQLQCPRTYSDEEVLRGYEDFSDSSFERHPFQASHGDSPTFFREAWPFDAASQVLVCGPSSVLPPIAASRTAAQVVCLHYGAGLVSPSPYALQCNQVELGGLICSSLYDRPPEVASDTVVCAPLRFMPEPPLARSTGYQYFSECAPSNAS